MSQFDGSASRRGICWIDTIDPEDAGQALTTLFQATGVPGRPVGHLYQAYGLRPHFLGPAHALYLAGLHHEDNTLAPWVLELVASYVAILTECAYALAHHGENFCNLHSDRSSAESILEILRQGQDPSELLDTRILAILSYAKVLTLTPAQMTETDIERLRHANLGDGEILEVNQVCAMFNYWTRVINGLGIRLGDEPIGLDGPATAEAKSDQG